MEMWQSSKHTESQVKAKPPHIKEAELQPESDFEYAVQVVNLV